MTQWGLDTLFNPAKRHMDEEKRRLQSTREEIGDSSGGKRIDLESGKVSISRAQPKDDGEDDATPEAEAADSAELVDGAAAEPQAEAGTPQDDGPGPGADADGPGADADG
ncbi:MAG: DUF6191 domain-containing protein [Actinomycetota bacterium]|nr:DUF6191 domain-containing protein [Actinomycetota bacterium]